MYRWLFKKIMNVSSKKRSRRVCPETLIKFFFVLFFDVLILIDSRLDSREL
jgi:hypothetical protein